jgi:putative heme-binding domain-containing protein
LIADRGDSSIVPALTQLVEEKTGQISLEALWALHLCGGLTESIALLTLDHPDPFVRLWTARLLCDENKASPAIVTKLVHVAQTEPDLEARDALACSARRLGAKDDLAIVRNLLGHDEDASDNRIPLLLWWAIESKAESDRDQVLALFEDTTLWSHQIVKKEILERIMRRYALAGTRKDLLSCAKLFELSPSRESSEILVKGFEAAMEGRSLVGMPDELLRAMARFDVGSVPLGLREGKPEAVKTALQTIADQKARANTRLEYIGILGEVSILESVPVLLGLLDQGANSALVKAAMNALQHYDDPKIGAQVVARYNQLDAAVQPSAQSLLASRAGWTRQWLEAMEAGQLKPAGVSQNVVRTVRLHKDPEVQRLAGKIFPNLGRPTSAEMEKQIKRLAGVIRGGVGDPYNGRKLFQATCAVCHTLFSQGGQVGPDLTTYKRDELDTLLLNIVNPSAEIREGYENYLVETTDDRSLNGFLVEQNTQVVVLRGLDGQNVALDRKNIVKMGNSGMSLMPEGLLDGLNDQQARDLFAYLRSSQPLVVK